MKRGTILLLEDESALAMLIGRILKEAGYIVLQAATGNEAIQIGRTNPGTIDLLIADIVLKGGYGPAVATQIGAFQPNLRTIFVSGYPVEALAARDLIDSAAVDSGATSFLQKPFSPDLLLEAVEDKFCKPEAGAVLQLDSRG